MKTLVLAAAAVAALAGATAAHADAPYFTFDGSSGTFGDNSITGKFANEDSFFTGSGLFDITLSTSSSSGVMFSTMSFDGMALQYEGKLGANTFYGLSGVDVTAGSQMLDVAGEYTPTKAHATGSYAGTLAFTPVSAAPEPATWSLMIAGVALVGGALRLGRRNGWSANAA